MGGLKNIESNPKRTEKAVGSPVPENSTLSKAGPTNLTSGDINVITDLTAL